MPKFVTHYGIPACLCVLMIYFRGCGTPSEGQPDLGSVTGIVTLDGKALPNACVTFIPDHGRPSYGTTDATGMYAMNYFGTTAGAATGTHRVMIVTALAGPPGPSYRDPIPPRYNTESTLSANVEPGENLLDFDLSSHR